MKCSSDSSIAGHTSSSAVSRRRALALLGAAAFSSRQARGRVAASTPVPSDGNLPIAECVRSSDGVLALTLDARPATVDMRAPQPVSTYTFDGVVPGRTLELNAGDLLNVTLTNNLPPLDGHEHPVDLTRPHEWTTTNLHTHGLHVSPSGNSDNVFVSIPPGERFDYAIQLPNDHPGGLFWYHPHRHGGVTQQVRGGMAGALIVRGELDAVPEVAAAKEHVIVLQAIELGDEFQLLDPIPNPTTEQAFFPRTQILYTANGVLNPRIRMAPGEVQRWRFVNAAEGKFMALELQDHDLHVLAWDGLTLASADQQASVMLAAGNRVDLLVRAGKPGVYELTLSPGSSQHPDIPGMAHATPWDPSSGPPTGELAPRPVLTVEVTGDAVRMALPDSLPAFDPPMLPIARTREFAYTVDRLEDNTFLSFGVDGHSFDPDRAPYQVKLNTAEEWTLYNGVDNRLPEHAHGFHIHVNPFKVIAVNGRPLAKPVWYDTFALSGITGDSITFQSNFTDFTGKFVNHCHILAHEDLGMMEAIEVIP
jgi:FtsP/CotA-like multicopper oxidase with cupredoxin domain